MQIYLLKTPLSFSRNAFIFFNRKIKAFVLPFAIGFLGLINLSVDVFAQTSSASYYQNLTGSPNPAQSGRNAVGPIKGTLDSEFTYCKTQATSGVRGSEGGQITSVPYSGPASTLATLITNGAAGGSGGNNDTFSTGICYSNAGNGGTGGNGGSINTSIIGTFGTFNAIGIYASTAGGAGGNAGSVANNGSSGSGGTGGAGGNGGAITLTNDAFFLLQELETTAFFPKVWVAWVEMEEVVQRGLAAGVVPD